MTVKKKGVEKLVETELPFLGLEKALMFLTEEGVDRQKVCCWIVSWSIESLGSWKNTWGCFDRQGTSTGEANRDGRSVERSILW